MPPIWLLAASEHTHRCIRALSINTHAHIGFLWKSLCKFAKLTRSGCIAGIARCWLAGALERAPLSSLARLAVSATCYLLLAIWLADWIQPKVLLDFSLQLVGFARLYLNLSTEFTIGAFVNQPLAMAFPPYRSYRPASSQ